MTVDPVGAEWLEQLALARDTCPCCGSVVAGVHQGREGTSSYVPLPTAELVQVAVAAEVVTRPRPVHEVGFGEQWLALGTAVLKLREKVREMGRL